MIQVGVIGYGYWGPNIVRNFNGLEGSKVVAVSDLNEGSLKKVKKVYPDLRVTTICDEVICATDVDVIAIVTPVFTHFELAKKALEMGKHVLVEKPFTSTTAQAEELIERAEKKNLKILVDHTFLYTGAVRKIKQLIEDGTLGDLCYFDSTRVNLGLFQHDVNVVWDLAPHDLAIMSDGTFIFCPVPSGIFDVVVDALVPTSTGSIAYNATITFGVPSGTAMGSIPIVAEIGASTSPASISGQITTTTVPAAPPAATQADISLSALQTANGVPVTIPLLGSSTPNVTTQPGVCPANTDCVVYTLMVPASNPSFGAFSVNPPTHYSVPAVPPINYTVDAQAFTIPTNPNPGVSNCASPSIEAPVTVQPGVTTIVDFNFTGCQP